MTNKALEIIYTVVMGFIPQDTTEMAFKKKALEILKAEKIKNA